MNYTLPTSLDICGTTYEIRSDYRAALDICAVLSDPDLSRNEKIRGTLTIFYPAFDPEDSAPSMPPEHYQEAVEKCFWFINGGTEDDNAPAPKLMDWEQDFPRIAAPVSRVLGTDIRGMEYLHWWSFLAAFMEIGDCLFAQIVRIRDLKARHKRLDKTDQEWYRRNRKLVDLKTVYSKTEQDMLSKWTGRR